MNLSSVNLLFGGINTIPIPIDAVFIIILLIMFVLIVYSFNNLLENKTNKLISKFDGESNFEIVQNGIKENLTPNLTSLNKAEMEKTKVKKRNFLSPIKFVEITGLVVLGIGGSSLLGLQSTQKSYEGVKTSQIQIMSKHQSINPVLPKIIKLPLKKTQIQINRVKYTGPLVSDINKSQIKNSFTF